MATRKLILISLFAAIICILSITAIPLTPVPITLQVFAILITGAILGRKSAPIAVLVYIFLGSVGLPVFAQGDAGFSVLIGPLGGYLIGFVAASFIIGLTVDLGYEKISRKGTKLFILALSMILGIIVIYIFGVVQLSIVRGLSLEQAFMAGCLPFIPFDIAKAVVAVLLAYPIKEQLTKLQLDR